MRRHSGAMLRAFFVALATLISAIGVALTVATYFARKVLTPARKHEAGVEVLATEPSATSPTGQRIWIQGPDASLRGAYSFIWADGSGHAKLGPVLERRIDRLGARVARDVLAVDAGEMKVGSRGRVTGWWFTGPEELGLRYERVLIDAEHGHIWAWAIYADDAGTGETPGGAAVGDGRWAVHVHGRGARPEETLRGVLPLARAGVSNLVIAYRNDEGASPGAYGRYGLGLAEWRDIDSALSWLAERGVSRATLVGWSMGATACVIAATKGQHRSLIDGMVLDSPALDWPRILMHQARLAKLPSPLAVLAIRLLSLGRVRGAVTDARGTDVTALSADHLARLIRVPTLVHVSAEDTFVSWEGAQRVAQLRPDLVTLRVALGEHVKLWNEDPQGWEAATEEFVRGLGDPLPHSRD